MKIRTWKFNPDAKCSLEDLSDSRVYSIKTKLESGVRLSLDENLWLTERANTSTCVPRGCVALMGWSFDFSDYLRRYVYFQYGSWQEWYAPNKTTLRKSFTGGSQIKHILEVK